MSERKVALVIHGMNTIGTAVCRRLQRDGYAVMATAPLHRCMPSAWLAAQRDDGFDFRGACVDIGAPDDCAALIGQLLASHGRLDVLVHVAATAAEGDASQLGALAQPQWRAALRLAVDGAFNICKQAVVAMLERRRGRIIQILVAPGAQPLALAAGTANAALHGLTKALALETACHGITVNTVAPGWVRDAAAPLVAAPQIPVGRPGEAAEVAALVSYLVSDDAAFITGAQLAINGGQYMS